MSASMIWSSEHAPKSPLATQSGCDEVVGVGAAGGCSIQYQKAPRATIPIAGLMMPHVSLSISIQPTYAFPQQLSTQDVTS